MDGGHGEPRQQVLTELEISASSMSSRDDSLPARQIKLAFSL